MNDAEKRIAKMGICLSELQQLLFQSQIDERIKTMDSVTTVKPDYDRAWNLFLTDERLAKIRKKLSMHDVRKIFYVAVEGLLGPPPDVSTRPKEPPHPLNHHHVA